MIFNSAIVCQVDSIGVLFGEQSAVLCELREPGQQCLRTFWKAEAFLSACNILHFYHSGGSKYE